MTTKTKLTAEQRSQLQSARAKNRKMTVALGAAGAMGVTVPKAAINHAKALEEYFAKLLDKAPVETEAEAA